MPASRSPAWTSDGAGPLVTVEAATARSTGAAPTAAVVAILCISGTVVALQQTLVVPLLPDFPEVLAT